MTGKIRQRKVPALVGRQEAAAILGCHPSNLTRDFPDLPLPISQRHIPGHEVARAQSLWVRAEVEELRDQRALSKELDALERRNGTDTD